MLVAGFGFGLVQWVGLRRRFPFPLLFFDALQLWPGVDDEDLEPVCRCQVKATLFTRTSEPVCAPLASGVKSHVTTGPNGEAPSLIFPSTTTPAGIGFDTCTQTRMVLLSILKMYPRSDVVENASAGTYATAETDPRTELPGQLGLLSPWITTFAEHDE